ncbi:MAG: sporulation integral membrane protein YtvI [Clostridia bacterium]|nr:sporulation integral membrane protein YtvI [Clostridia bacterium]
MTSLTENRRVKFLINVFFIAVCVAMAYFALRYLPGLFVPFIFALLIVLATNPLVNLVERKLKIPRKIGGPIIVILAIGLIVVAFYFLITVVLGEATSLVKDIGNLMKSLPEKWENIINSYEAFLNRIGLPEVLRNAFNFSTLVGNMTESLSKTFDVQNIVSGIVTNASSFLFSFFITVVATVLLSADYVRIRAFVMRQLSPKHQKTMLNVKVFMKTTVWGYTKTYAIIFAFYFVSMYLLFLVMHLNHAMLLSFIIALIDLLPVVGLGVVFIPWAIINFIGGDIWFGIILVVAYVVLTFVRNLIEPKLIGKQVGIHPFVALLALYLGLELFGFIGVFVLPLVVILLKSEHDAGRLHIWK